MAINQMTVKELKMILEEYDETLPVEIFAYGESSQSMDSYEVDFGVEDDIVVLTPGRSIKQKASKPFWLKNN